MPNGENGNLVISAFQEATSIDPEKQNKRLALSLQHHNEGAANAAQMHGVTENIVRQLDDSEFKDAAAGILSALWDGYYASNSHLGRYVRDYLVQEHKVAGMDVRDPNAGGNFMDRLLGSAKKKQQ